MEDAQGAMEQARLAYESAKQEEIAALTQADNSIREAQSALDKLKTGATADDLTAAQADVDRAQAALDKLKAGATADDLAAAQAGVDRAQAALDKLKAGPAAEDLATAQAAVDRAQAALDKLKAGPSADDLAAAQAGVDRARAQLNDVKAGPKPEAIREAQAGVDQARANLDKVKQGATPQEITQAEAQVKAAQAALDLKQQGASATDRAILDAQVRLSELSVATAQAQIADAQLKAPFDGVVLAINVKEGELTGGQPVVELADLHTLRVTADIDEIDVGRVAPGQPVTVTLDAYPGERLPGAVERLALGATQKQGSTIYEATIVFTPTATVQPRAGMAANVKVTAQRKDHVLLVPNRALETIGSSQFVTVQEGNTGRKVKVETGLANAQDTEIIDDGTLREGQTVVVR
jgi:HlyD family secretion protein